MADDVKKAINIDVNAVVSDKSLDGLQKLNALTDARAELLENIDKLKKSSAKFSKEELKAEKEKVKEIEKAIKLKPGSKGKFNLEEFSKGLQEIFVKGAKTLTDALGLSWQSFASLLKDVIKSVQSEMSEMLQSSLMTSSTTRSNVFKYGLSAGQNYGFVKARSYLGIESSEDLMYMNAQQSEMFQSIMTEYSRKYNELYNKGFFDTLLKYQVERAKFQDEIEIRLIQMFVDNKDTIIGGINTIMKISETLLKILDWISGRQTQSASETIKNYTTKQINVNSTFNITGQTNDMSIVQAGEQGSQFIVDATKNLA